LVVYRDLLVLSFNSGLGSEWLNVYDFDFGCV
jgi:hypothetical protein